MRKNWLLIASCFLYFSVSAQQISPKVVNAAGSSISNSSVQLAFNVGEPAVTKISNGNNIITQGFLQPPSGQVSIKEHTATYHFDAYPNPSNSELNLRSAYDKAYTVKLTDALGHLVYQGTCEGKLSLQSMQEGVYELIIMDDNNQILDRKTIVKINN